MPAASSDSTSTYPLSGGRDTQPHAIRLMTPADLDRVVAWHREAFPAGFYAQLGPGFMRAWFSAHLAAPASVSLVACDGGGVIEGYLVGTLDDASYRERSAWESARVLVHGTAAFLVRPRLWGEFARRRSRPYAARVVRRMLRRRPATGGVAGAGELIYICVERDHRRRGAGAALLEAYTGEALRCSTQHLHLVTELDNVGAQRFYVRHGWRVMDDTAHALDGRTLVRMQRDLVAGAVCAD